MKNIRITKKVVALVLSVVLAFSAIGIMPFESSAVVAHEHKYNDEWTTEIESTCKYAGLRYKLCIVDGCTFKLEETVPINRNAHNFKQESIKIQATCKNSGEETTKCTLCGEVRTIYVQKLAHTVDENKWTVEKKGTCTEVGREKNSCTVCGSDVRRDIIVEHVKASNVPVAVKPSTCSTRGEAAYTCKTCNMAVITEPLDLDEDNHVYTTNPYNITGVTHYTDGKGTVICRECANEKEVTVSKDRVHEFLEWKIITELPEDATCISDYVGSMRKSCDVCGYYVDQTFTPEHKLAEGYTTRLSTCVSEGYQRGDCKICQNTGRTNNLPIDEDAHKWTEVVLKEATCHENGKILKVCQYDDSHVVIEDIEKKEHNLVTNWEEIAPNCREEGLRYGWCVNESCGFVSEKIPVDVNAHVFAENVQWIQDPDNPPTCYKEGKEYAMCQKCFDLISRDVPKHTNTLKIYKYTAPTCQTEGIIEYACTGCGTGNIEKEILPKDKDAHVKSTNPHPVKFATCYSEGMMAHTCLCGYVFDKEGDEIEILTPTSHTVTDWDITLYPTCTTDGKIERRCINENCTYIEENTMPATHSFTTWLVTKEATCKADGERQRYCYTCNITETESFTGSHENGTWVFENGKSCATGGTARLICGVCNLSYDVKTVKAGEHIELVLKELNSTGDMDACSSEIYQCIACDDIIKKGTPHTLVSYSRVQAYDDPHEICISEKCKKDHKVINGKEYHILCTDDKCTKYHKPVESTCETNGWGDKYYCLICLNVFEQNYIPAEGHTFRYDDEGTKYCIKCNIYFVDEGVIEVCDHFCHDKGTVNKILTKILAFFWKIFNMNHICKCGEAHYHNDSTEIVSTKFNDKGKLLELTYSCEECNAKNKKVQFK